MIGAIASHYVDGGGPGGGGNYDVEVLADSPLAYYRLGESSGTSMVDASGNGRNGTYTGVTLGASGALSGDTDTAITLAGASTSYASVPFAAWMSPAAVTLEAWVKSTSTDAVVFGTMQTFGQPYYLRISSTLGLYFAARTSGGDSWANNTGQTVRDGNWHHIVGTFTPGTIKAYLDGALVATNTGGAYANSLIAATSDLAIGRRGNGLYFGGQVDEVAIYGTALSATRVAAHYAAATA